MPTWFLSFLQSVRISILQPVCYNDRDTYWSGTQIVSFSGVPIMDIYLALHPLFCAVKQIIILFSLKLLNSQEFGEKLWLN